jgi:hypothetical protein
MADKQKSIDNIENTFLVNEIKLSDLFINLSLDEVMKLQYYNIYQEIKNKII